MNEVGGRQARRRTRSPVVRCWAMVAAVTALVVAGCDSSPEPTETPEPQVTYEAVASNMCEQIRMEQVATRFGLKLRSSYDRTVLYDPRGSYVYLSCDIRAYDDGDRFRTPLGEFDPAGTVRLRTYPDHAEAEGAHESEVYSLRAHERAGRYNASSQEVKGWWDEGVYVQLSDPIDPKTYPRFENLDATAVEMFYELRHGNLLVTTHLDTRAPTPQTEEVFAFLRDFAQAYADEAVSHLSRTGPD